MDEFGPSFQSRHIFAPFKKIDFELPPAHVKDPLSQIYHIPRFSYRLTWCGQICHGNRFTWKVPPNPPHALSPRGGAEEPTEFWNSLRTLNRLTYRHQIRYRRADFYRVDQRGGSLPWGLSLQKPHTYAHHAVWHTATKFFATKLRQCLTTSRTLGGPGAPSLVHVHTMNNARL